MTGSRYHASLMLLLLFALSLFCTVTCTVLTFERSGNNITLRCVSDLQNRFPILSASFSVRTPGSMSRQPVKDFTRRQNHEIMFTLIPETEGYFSCQNPSNPNVLSEELLLAGE